MGRGGRARGSSPAGRDGAGAGVGCADGTALSRPSARSRPIRRRSLPRRRHPGTRSRHPQARPGPARSSGRRRRPKMSPLRKTKPVVPLALLAGDLQEGRLGSAARRAGRSRPARPDRSARQAARRCVQSERCNRRQNSRCLAHSLSPLFRRCDVVVGADPGMADWCTQALVRRTTLCILRRRVRNNFNVQLPVHPGQWRCP